MIGIVESPCELSYWTSIENRASKMLAEAIHYFLHGRNIESTNHRRRKALLGTLVDLMPSLG